VTTELFLPRMGSTTMTHGVLIEWLVREGDVVEADQAIAEVETDKTNFEIPAPAAGTVLRLTAAVGEEVPVGAVIGYLGEPGEQLPADAPPSAVAPAAGSTAAGPTTTGPTTAGPNSPAAATSGGAPGAPTPTPAQPDILRASPAARRRAANLGVDLSTVVGTGPQGRIRSSDIDAALARQQAAAAAPGPASSPAAAPAPVSAPVPTASATTAASAAVSAPGSRASRVRRATARRMAESARQVAPVTLTREVDVEATLAVMADVRDSGVARPGLLDYVISAVADALPAHPQINATYSEEAGTVPLEDVSIGFAVQAPVGLLVPTLAGIRGATPTQVWSRRRLATDRALADRLDQADVAPAGITVSNLGGHGIDIFTPIVSPPQVAILGVGRLRERIVLAAGRPVVRRVVWLSLTFDHRAVDGAPAAEFLAAVAERLEAPTPQAHG
jgi:pyruvate dehydrogenase E2 component (dihydrolipoamide acetyltransferase)